MTHDHPSISSAVHSAYSISSRDTVHNVLCGHRDVSALHGDRVRVLYGDPDSNSERDNVHRVPTIAAVASLETDRVPTNWSAASYGADPVGPTTGSYPFCCGPT